MSTDYGVPAGLTTESVAAKVREIAAERPDFTYRKMAGHRACFYVHRDPNTLERIEGQGCIVGQAFAALGWVVPLELEQKGVRVVLELVGRDVDNEAGHWLDLVQGQQDGGATWDMAVKNADAYFACHHRAAP